MMRRRQTDGWTDGRGRARRTSEWAMNVRCPFVLRSIFSGWSIASRGKRGTDRVGRGGRGTCCGVRPSVRSIERGESLIVLMWPKTNLDTARRGGPVAAEEASAHVSKKQRRFQIQHRKSECEKNLLRIANAAAIAFAVAVLRGWITDYAKITMNRLPRAPSASVSAEQKQHFTQR